MPDKLGALESSADAETLRAQLADLGASVEPVDDLLAILRDPPALADIIEALVRFEPKDGRRLRQRRDGTTEYVQNTIEFPAPQLDL